MAFPSHQHIIQLLTIYATALRRRKRPRDLWINSVLEPPGGNNSDESPKDPKNIYPMVVVTSGEKEITTINNHGRISLISL